MKKFSVLISCIALLIVSTGCGLNDPPIAAIPTAIPTSAVALQQVLPTEIDSTSVTPEVAVIPEVQVIPEVIQPLAPAAEESANAAPLPTLVPTLAPADSANPTPQPLTEVEIAAAYPVPPVPTETTDTAAYPVAPAPVTSDNTAATDAYPIPAADQTASSSSDAYPMSEEGNVEDDALEPDTAVDASPVPPSTDGDEGSLSTDAYPAPVTSQDTTEIRVPMELAGLVTKDSEGVSVVLADGRVRQLLNINDTVSPDAWVLATVAVSADYQEFAALLNGDLQTYSRESNAFVTVGPTPVRIECCYLDWLGPGRWLFGTAESVEPSSGIPTLIDTRSNSITLFSDRAGFGLASVHNGMIAFEEAGTPRIANVETGVFSNDELGAVGKAWSSGWEPGGNRVAWLAQQAEGLMSLTVFNRDTQETDYLHLYPPAILDGWQPNRPAWQPNGSWVAFETIDSNSADFGIWLVDVDTENEQYLGPGSRPIWNPDGTQLAWQTSTGINVYDVTTNQFVSDDLTGELISWQIAP